jgi:hypothetical protein
MISHFILLFLFGMQMRWWWKWLKYSIRVRNCKVP